MVKKNSYKPIEPSVWQGRIDDQEDYDSFRWHQVIQPINLPEISKIKAPLLSGGFCFLGFCCDEGVKRNGGRIGTSKGPLSLRHEMVNLPCNFNNSVRLYDAGDIYCLDGSLETAQMQLKEAVQLIVSLGLIPIVLGGGHEIAFGHYSGLVESEIEEKTDNRTNIGIINLDAHFDLRPYDNGASSGSMFLQIADLCQKQNRIFSCLYLGIQISGNTRRLFTTAQRINADYILAKDINETSLSDTCYRLDKFIKRHKKIYLTLCMDVFSSAFAPGVSAPQPFGLHPEIGLVLIKHIVKSGKMVGFDIAEISPRFDEDNRTAKLGAIIIFALVNTLGD